jgi:hypothetical protein
MAIGPIQLLRQATTEQRRTLLATALGWMLDAFDAMLYALVLAHVMRDLGMSKAIWCCSKQLAVGGARRRAHGRPSLAPAPHGLIIPSQQGSIVSRIYYALR